MSTAVTVTQVPGGRLAVWDALAGAESGAAVSLLGFGDWTAQVSGTFGSATVAFEGSNDGTTWFPLTDGSAAIGMTAAGGSVIVERPVYIRAKTSGGTASALKVSVIGGTLHA